MFSETVTISSDEETDSNSSQVKHFAPVTPVLSQSQTDIHAAPETGPARHEDEFPFFPDDFPKKLPVSRRSQMEDEVCDILNITPFRVCT